MIVFSNSEGLMRYLLFAITFFSLITTGFTEDDDGGWSSSGGGNFIITQHNPWFMGWVPVKWCIDHGGKDNFSLSENLAKIEIERAILQISSQLRRTNDSDSSIPRRRNGFAWGNCGVRWTNTQHNYFSWEQDCVDNWTSSRGNPDMKMISDNFEYVSECKNAELEFILGNSRNRKVKKLKKLMGKNNFLNIVATAMRTSYDISSLRGKGFIYVASDIGKNRYKGIRGNYSPKESGAFWNIWENIPFRMPLPSDLDLWYDFKDLDLEKYFLRDHSLGPLAPV